MTISYLNTSDRATAFNSITRPWLPSDRLIRWERFKGWGVVEPPLGNIPELKYLGLMKYFTNLFTHKSWQEFKVQGGTISGQSEHRHARCSKMQPGDRLLCYLVGASRWIGVLEITGPPYLDFDEKNRIWQDNLYPSRIPVKIILECEPEISPDVKPDIYEYSVMADIKPSSWGTLFLGSLNQWPVEDGTQVEKLIQDANAKPVSRPLPPRAYSISGYQTVETETGVLVTVPSETEASGVIESTEKTGTEHTRVQLILSQLGHAMGFKVHIPASDRSKTYEDKRINEIVPLVEQLNLGLIPTMMRVIKNIDVLWIDDDAVVGAFEIESTTSIYSGILRMADLLSLQPNFQINCYLVAPDSREVEVFNQVNRPVFTKMKKPFRDSCRFIPFSSLTELGPDDFVSFKHQKISYIEEEFSESLIPSDV